MTIDGAVNKSFILLLLLIVSAYFSWTKIPETSLGIGLVLGVVILNFIISLIAVFFPRTTPVTAPLYALAEGVLVGVVSKTYEAAYNGIVMQAVLITVSIFFALLVLYKTGIVKASENFKLGVISATLGVALVYFLTNILGIFGVHIPYIHSNEIIGILFSLAVVFIAALNLVLDFDFIEEGARMNVPKYMEWYGAFGLLVTLVWLYFEILNLLRKIYSRN